MAGEVKLALVFIRSLLSPCNRVCPSLYSPSHLLSYQALRLTATHPLPPRRKDGRLSKTVANVARFCASPLSEVEVPCTPRVPTLCDWSVGSDRAALAFHWPHGLTEAGKTVLL